MDLAKKLIGYRKLIEVVVGGLLSVAAMFSPFVATNKDNIIGIVGVILPSALALIGIAANIIVQIINKQPVTIPEAPDLEEKE
jgi:hypothetical protein